MFVSNRSGQLGCLVQLHQLQSVTVQQCATVRHSACHGKRPVVMHCDEMVHCPYVKLVVFSLHYTCLLQCSTISTGVTCGLGLLHLLQPWLTLLGSTILAYCTLFFWITLLCSTILPAYTTVLYYTILAYTTVLYYTILASSTVLYYTILAYITLLYYNILAYNTVVYYTRLQ